MKENTNGFPGNDCSLTAIHVSACANYRKTNMDWKTFLIRFVLSAFICVHLWIQVPSSAAQTLTGIDVLEAQKFAPLAGKRVGLITNQTGIDRHGRSTIDLLAHAPSVKLVALFSPEHGIRGTLDANVDSSKDV